MDEISKTLNLPNPDYIKIDVDGIEHLILKGGKNVLLFGSEGFGMREHTGKYTDFFVKIDINKDVESLNISNSAAIVFHHLSYLKKNS